MTKIPQTDPVKSQNQIQTESNARQRTAAAFMKAHFNLHLMMRLIGVNGSRKREEMGISMPA